MPTLSIIIPTHKRADILRRTLEHVEAQTIKDELEVIVVSDGHDEKTAEFMNHHTWQVPVKFIEIPKSHQGAARNKGVSMAKAPLALFIGDDIFLHPEACEQHVRAHRNPKYKEFTESNWDLGFPPRSVLGFTTWDSTLRITPVMQWLEKTGWQFGYGKIKQHAHGFLPAAIQHSFTYTSHISLPTHIAQKIQFLDDVSLYGWEDIEWGLRLKNAGVRLFYEPNAKAYHHHLMILEESLKRMRTLGESAVKMEKLNPELDIVPKGFKKHAYKAVSFLPTMRGRHAKAFLEGLEKEAK